jgi:hypothetical protein
MAPLVRAHRLTERSIAVTLDAALARPSVVGNRPTLKTTKTHPIIV